MSDAFQLLLVGDLVLDEPDTSQFFDLARPTLLAADAVIGHLETPHTHRGREAVGDVPAPPADPENLKALGGAGFSAVSLAGNHMHDQGPDGIEDSIAGINAQGIVGAGAGANLAAARRPAVFERKGRKIGLLSYNCVGPKEGWAAEKRAGCAYLQIISHYEPEGANPGGPPKIYTFATPDSLDAMQADIEALRPLVDTLVVAFHKGVVHTPAHLSMYERPVARAAIEAGADIVTACHAHILRGVETYKGRPIYHGLGNFVTVTHALNVEGNDSPERRAWAIRRKVLFGFEPDPAYPLYPFHPESKNAMIADCRIDAAGKIGPGFIPCWIQPTAQPEPVGRTAKGEEVLDYVVDITRRAGLKTEFAWDGDRVVFQ